MSYLAGKTTDHYPSESQPFTITQKTSSTDVNYPVPQPHVLMVTSQCLFKEQVDTQRHAEAI